MAVVRFEPTHIQVWDFNSLYRNGEPILTGTAPNVAYMSFVWIDEEEVLSVINATSINRANIHLNVIEPGRLTVSMHKESTPSEDTRPRYYTTGAGWHDLARGTHYFDVNELRDGVRQEVGDSYSDYVTLAEALEHGFMGFVFYSGDEYPTLEAADFRLEIEGDFDNQSPTVRSPVGGQTQNINEPVTFTWSHNSPLNQKGYELRYRLQGTSEWITVERESNEQSYNLPANTLSVGDYEWQVRTVSEFDFVSPWSQIAVFNVAETTPSPVFINPTDNSVVEISDLYVEWDSVDQHRYEFELRDNNNNIVWSDARISTNQDLTVKNILENNQSYRLRLRVNQEGNFFSPWVAINIDVDYTQPADPILEITPNEVESNLRIFIDNPAPTDTEPQAVNQELYKREPGGSWIKLADLLPNSDYVDYAVASDQVYEYRVTVHGNNDTSTRSSVFSGSVKVDYTVLNLANEPSQFIKLEIVRDRSGSTNLNETKKQFAGRRFPVTEFGETLENDVDIECLVTPDEYKFLIDLFKRQETLIYRDSRGRKMYATVASFSFVDEYKQYVSISTSFSQVDYKEGID